jgi:uncharacterized membrane protein YhaH (DUF805 family)
MDFVYLFTSFHGRISREPFWLGFLAVVLAEFVGHTLAVAIQGDQLDSIVGLALNYPEFALLLKRAYDRDQPIWLVATYFIGDAVLNFLGLQGLSGNDLWVAAYYLWLAYLLALIIDLGFGRGTAGPNRYGPDPLADKAS